MHPAEPTDPPRTARRSTRRLLVLGALAVAAVCVAVTATLYVGAPVDALRRVVVYQPAGSSTARQAGLATTNVALADVPDTLLVALLWNEDKRFLDHHGFDFEELGTGIHEWVTGERRLRGASTITQQLARMIFLDGSRTLRRKLVEAVYTVKLERRFAKREILLLYLNNVEWGPDVYGLAAATRHYFGKAPSELTRGECVFLAAILPDPKRLGAGFRERHFSRGTRIRVARLTTAVDRVLAARDAPVDANDVARVVAAVQTLKGRGDAAPPES